MTSLSGQDFAKGTIGACPPIAIEQLIDSTPLCWRQLVAIALCAILSMLDGFDLQVIAFAAPEIGRDWGEQSAAFGPVFSAGLFGGMIGGFVLAPLSDRYGPKKTLICNVALFGLFTWLSAFATTIEQLMLLRGIAGMGLGGALPSILALLSVLSPGILRSRIVIAGICGQVIGAVIGGLIASQLIPRYGWPSVFLLGGATPILLLPLVLCLVPESPAFLVARQKSTGAITRALQMAGKSSYLPPDPSFVVPTTPARVSPRGLIEDGRAVGTVWLMLASLIGITFFYFIVNWVPSILRDGGLTTEWAVLGSVFLNAGGAVGAIAASIAVPRLGIQRIMIWGFFIGGLFTLALGLGSGNLPITILLVLGVGLFGFAAQLSQAILVLTYYPPHLHGTAIGFALGAGRIGAVIGPLVGSYLLLNGAKPADLFYFAGACAIGAALCLMAMRRFGVAPRAY